MKTSNPGAAEAADSRDYISLSEAAQLMRGRGSRGRHPSVESLRRWANPKRGCKPLGKGGPTIFLRVARVNGQLCTTEVWALEFERLRVQLGTREARPVPAAEQSRPPRAREAADRRAREYLAREGIGRG